MFTLLPAFRYGWQQMQKHFWIFIAFTLALSSIDIWGNIKMKAAGIDELIMMENWWTMIPDDLITWMGIFAVVIVCINFVVVTLVLANIRNESPWQYLLEKSTRIPAYLGAFLLKLCIVSIGTLLFIIPGVIAFLGLYFMEYLVIDKDMSIIDALKESWRITSGFRLGIFFFEVNVFIFSYLLSFPQSLWPDTITTYGILVLINTMWLPVSWLAAGYIYRFVSEQRIIKQ